MPLYLYKCACGASFDQYEHMDGSHVSSPCPCGKVADRVWLAPYAAVDNTEAHFNNGLGVEVHNRGDIAEAKRRYHGDTGGTLHELGTEKKWRAKRERKKYPSTRETLQMIGAT